ncbi:MAG: alkaline phosphatase family protein, partial [Cyclobacteriaceae bacterium]|nr:alkaline phosphatase family protein [Cyclobacteriaceae bacterium]
ERPQMITMYFSDMDDTGHRYGPHNDEQLKKTLDRLDHELGALFEGVASFDLPVTIVIVSDHGMADVPKENLLNLTELMEGIDARVVNSGALAHIHLANPSQKKKIIELIESRGEYIHVVDVADREYYKDLSLHADLMGDLLIMPDLGYYLADERGLFRYQNRSAMNKTDVFGEHGYIPDFQEMQGIFYAKGPQIKEGLIIEPFENYHIYPLICKILGLTVPAGIDGNIEVLAPILK